MEQAQAASSSSTRALSDGLGRIAAVASLIAITIGLLGFVGNACNIAWLLTAGGHCPPLKLCCASGLVLLGLSLWMQTRAGGSGWWFLAGRMLGGLTLLLTLTRLGYYGLPTELHVPLTTLFSDDFIESLPEDRPSLVSSLCLFLVSAGLLWGNRRVALVGRVAQWFGLGATLTATLGLIGYSYCLMSFFSVAPLTRLPPHALLAFFLLGLGIATLKRDDWLRATLNSSGPGGMIARRFLPAAIVVPVVLSGLRLAAEFQHVFDTPMGTALLALANVVVFIVLVGWGARMIDRVDLARQIAGHTLEAERADLERRVAERSRDLEAGNRALRVQIDQRRRLEAKTRANEARLRRVVESDMIGIFFWQADGVITEANEAFLQLLGYTAEHVASGRLCWPDLTPPEFRGRDARAMEELRRRGVCTAYEKQLVRHDNTRVAVLLGASILDDEGRQGVAYVVDMTERKQLEYQLRQRANELAEIDRCKNEFLALLGHELRNPLAAIDNALKLIPLLEPTDPDHEHAWGILLRQSGHMGRLVDDLLDVSRVSRGKIQLKRRRMLALEGVSHAIDVVRPVVNSRRQQLRVELTDEPVWIDADSARFEQIIVNLLDNACKYTSEGGEITVTMRRDGDHVAISVRDSGMGMDADLLPRVFDLFSQAVPAGGQAKGGLGIGLFLVAGLVRLHQGSITAQSPGLGRGSEFIVRLPTVPVAIVELRSQPREVIDSNLLGGELEVSSAGQRVLLVEDNADVADMLKILLDSRGFEVQVASDGPAALAKAQSFIPDVVLMDIGLPGMNGYEAARRLRQLPGLDRAFMIAITGFGENEVASRAAGFDRHLVKPVAFDRLFKLLTEEAARTVQ